MEIEDKTQDKTKILETISALTVLLDKDEISIKKVNFITDISNYTIVEFFDRTTSLGYMTCLKQSIHLIEQNYGSRGLTIKDLDTIPEYNKEYKFRFDKVLECKYYFINSPYGIISIYTDEVLSAGN